MATNTAKINENTNAINNIIDGTTTLAKVTTSGNADIGGNLNVTGNTTLTGTLSATGGIETNNIKLNGKEISEVDTGTIAVSGAGNNKTVATTASVMKSAQNAEFTPGGSNAAGKKTINEAINALDTEIGADSDYGTLLNGDASKTVKENIAALDASIGKVADINAGNALTNGTGTKPTTVVEALNNVDATLGTVHGLRDKLQASGAGTNLAAGTTVEQHLTALDASIGNRSYSSTNYISSGSDLSSAVASLDNNLYRVEGDLSALKSRANKMHHEMKSGFASLAAMSALVPNARTAGDTQLSVGTGYYRGTTGFALGAFHHINDNVLLNAGAAYGGNGAATFKGGVTFGW